MAPKTIKLDTLPKLRRWVGRSIGQTANLYDVLQWLEEDPNGMALKSSVSHVVIRDVSAAGTPDDLRKLQELEYDLGAKCTYQVDGNALHAAVQFGKEANAMTLMEMGLDPRQRLYPTGPSALDEALINGHLKLFQTLSSGETTDQDREAFLGAALSQKTRKESWSKDEPKNRTLAFVLEHFGPFTQDQLNQALASAARSGWEACFATLVEAGAQPQTPSLLVHRRYSGHGNLMLELLSQVAIGRWEPILKRYGHHDEWFFPEAAASESHAQENNVIWLHDQVQRYRASILHPDILEAMSAIQSRRRHKDLNQVLDEPTPTRTGRPRF